MLKVDEIYKQIEYELKDIRVQKNSIRKANRLRQEIIKSYLDTTVIDLNDLLELEEYQKIMFSTKIKDKVETIQKTLK